MNKLTKILVVIASSLSMSFAAVAGELAVSGSANASYLISSGDGNVANKGVGISNELMFKASGELDNGYTWNYHTELDPNGGGTTDSDDAGLTINTNGMGTIGIFDSEGGLSVELVHGIGALGTGTDYANTWGATGNTASAWGFDVSSHPNIQYHTPADLLPYSIAGKIGFVPNTGDADSNSFKNSGGQVDKGVDGSNAIQYQLTAAPVDGLKLAADYIRFDGDTGAGAQVKQGGNVAAQYAFGNFKIGYFNGFTEDGVLHYANGDGTSFDRQETDGYGVEFAVNDNLSVSLSTEDHQGIDVGHSGLSGKIKTKTTMSSDIAQVAYNVGGATVGLYVNETDNSDFVAGQTEKKTIFSIAMEF